MNKIASCLFFMVYVIVNGQEKSVFDFNDKVFPKSNEYRVFVNKSEISIYTFDPLNNTCRIDFIYCNVQPNSVIEVKTEKQILSYTIFPISYNIKGIVTDRMLTFNSSSYEYFIVTINSNHKLILFIDTRQHNIPNLKAKNVYSICNFDIDNTGKKHITEAVQKALDEVSLNKGTLYFPAGIYKINGISIKSNTHIYLDRGVIIYAADNVNEYPQYKQGEKNKIELISIKNHENIVIEGPGIIMANGIKLAMSGEPPAKKDWAHGEIENVELRIHAFKAENSRNIAVKDILIMESTEWAITFFNCENISVNNAKVINYSDWFWSDGIHFTSCRNATADNCFVYCGDDAFVATTRLPNAPSKNIIFKNNLVGFTTCSAFRAGWYAYDTMKNVLFEKNIAISAGRGIDLVHYGYLGKPIQNITFRDINIENINDDGGTWQNRCPIFFDMRKQSRDPEKGKPGMVFDVLVENFKCMNWGPHCSLVKGFDTTAYFTSVVFKNIEISGNKILCPVEGNIQINDFNKNITFVK